MLKEKWEQVLQGTEVRQNLSKIRQEIKDDHKLLQFDELIQGSEDQLIALLQSEDAKTRKNAALLMGDLGIQEFLTPLWEAYEREQQKFVRSSYLTAIGNLDYREYLDAIKNQLERLRKAKATTENQKHLMEELRELSSLIVRIKGVQTHEFIGWNEEYDVILTGNRNHIDRLQDELLQAAPDAVIRPFGAGVMAHVSDLRWVREIRIYQELLFIVKGMECGPLVPEKLANLVVHSQVFNFLDRSHAGGEPWYFRVELKSKADLKQKSTAVKKIAALIEQKSDRRLINSADHYEFEIRLIENKKGAYNILIKLYTMQDKRFAYREEFMPTSIRPVNAALTAALAKDYLKEDAQVLDPFCGVGTMLIERNKAVGANTTFGVDIQEEAIEKARKNTEITKQIIHYVNRDFFRFQHDYLFDEVITNMPFRIGRVTEDEIVELYVRFFRSIPAYLKEQAILVLYSHDKRLAEQLAGESDFRILDTYEISAREGTDVLILRYDPQEAQQQ